MMQVTKVWWDGERLMAEPIDPTTIYQEPAQPQRWAVFCQGCRKEWSVSYPHPGKDICVDCDDKPAQQDSTCSNALRAQGKAYPRTCKKCGLGPCIADRVQPAQQEPVCAWQREDDDHMPGTWRSDCGVMWTFTDGSPVDNDMKYCCGCGAMLLEKNT